MTSSIVIAAITQTLVSRFQNSFDKPTEPSADLLLKEKVEVINQPPDTLKDISKNRLNVFLYHISPNAAWRNMLPPNQVRSGETGHPPLALNLNYLIIANGTEGDERSFGMSHRILGRAMSILHDNPIILTKELEVAVGNEYKDKLGDLIEPIRITHMPITTEEMSKIWTTFQVGYRVSAAYQVSVVMIDSTTAAKSPLPVLKRGEKDSGVSSLAGMPPFIDGIYVSNVPRDLRLSGSLKDELDITGGNLEGGSTTVKFGSPYIENKEKAFFLPPLPERSADKLQVKLPDPDNPDPDLKDPGTPKGVKAYNVMAEWHPGNYSVSLQIVRPDLGKWMTNEIPFSLAPTITVRSKDARPLIEGPITITISCKPYIRKKQRVMVIFGDRQISVPQVPDPPAKPVADKEATPMELSITIPDVLPKTYVVRLRVDGVDSIPLPPRVPTQPLNLQFDPNQMITVEKKPPPGPP